MSRIPTPLPEHEWTFAVRAEAGRRVVAVRADGTGLRLEATLASCRSDDAALEIDLAGCAIADSVLLNALMLLRAQAQRLGIAVCLLTGVTPRLRHLLDRCGFQRAFTLRAA